VQPDQLNAWRGAERARLLALRESQPAPLRAAWNERVTALLEQGFPVLRTLTTGLCWPYKCEFDARFAMRTLRAAGARSALPAVVARGQPLEFREWWPGVAMTPRVFNLPVPDGTEVLQPDALLIPPVGFDERGYRLGYGGGFFDRTLAARAPQPLKIAVGFEVSRMPTIHPQPWDVPMDFVVTEAGIHAVEAGRLRRVDVAECVRLSDALFAARQAGRPMTGRHDDSTEAG
jgi:5-formyltetrahydrofolate cyclo-ligase